MVSSSVLGFPRIGKFWLDRPALMTPDLIMIGQVVTVKSKRPSRPTGLAKSLPTSSPRLLQKSKRPPGLTSRNAASTLCPGEIAFDRHLISISSDPAVNSHSTTMSSTMPLHSMSSPSATRVLASPLLMSTLPWAVVANLRASMSLPPR